MTQKDPYVAFGTLERADGSATYSSNGYKVICGVNGPVEVQRRDELPEEATLEVNICPASGVAGVRERHLESIVHSTLRHIVLTKAHPRTLIQVTLQVVSSQEDERYIGGLPQAASNIDILPTLFQAAMLALLSASLPLTATLTSVLIAVSADGTIRPNPSSKDLVTSLSTHVLAYTSLGGLIAIESEGDFSVEEWTEVCQTARSICLGSGNAEDDDVRMGGSDQGDSLQDKLRDILHKKVESDNRWKGDLG